MNDPILKEKMMKIIENDIIKYKEYLQYFSLNPENYSKSLQLDLEEFSKKIKDYEEFFSVMDKNKLIFTNSDLSIDSDKIKDVNVSLNLIKFNLENLKIKLFSLKKNLDKSFDKSASSSDSKNYLFNFLEDSNKFKNFSSDPSEKNNLLGKSENIDFFSEKINKIQEIRLKIKEKEDILKTCNNDLRIYNGLPKDINQIKEMIKNKRIELEYL